MSKATLFDSRIKKSAYCKPPEISRSITNISGIKDIRGRTVTITGGIDEGKVWYK